MRARIFDSLLPLIPLLALLSAMPLTIALPVLALSVTGIGTLCALPRLMRGHAVFFAPAIAFFAWALASGLWSVDPAASLQLWVRVTIICVIGILGLHAVSRREPMGRRAALFYVVSFAACIAALVTELSPGGGLIALIADIGGGDHERYMRKTVNRGLCAFTVFVWPVMFLLYRQQKQPLAWALFALTAAAVFGMDSLSAQVGLFIGLLAFLLCYALPRRITRSLAVLVPLVFLSVPFATSALLDSPWVKTREDQLNDVGSGRLPIWDSLLAQAATKPWLGWGMDTAQQVPMAQEDMDKVGLTQTPLHPHLSALHIKLELGTVGLVLAALSIGCVLWRVASTALPTPCYALAMACAATYLGTGLSSFGIWQNWWVSAAWIAALLWARFASLPASAPHSR